jgi:transcriptional regulator with XRE-family HTH domain
MPANSELASALDRQLLLQLGERLKRTRLEQALTTTQMAERAGISRMTLSAIEAGEPSPTMGSYLRVMGVLGVSKDLALLGTDSLAKASSTHAPAQEARQASVSASDARHEIQDLQSLVLHEEAVRRMRKQPELIAQALHTLESWRSKGSANAAVLLDEWSVILRRRAWRKALSRTKRGRELRQASPVTTVLPPEVRQQIIEDTQRLKKGVVLGSLSATRSRPAKARHRAA